MGRKKGVFIKIGLYTVLLVDCLAGSPKQESKIGPELVGFKRGVK